LFEALLFLQALERYSQDALNAPYWAVVVGNHWHSARNAQQRATPWSSLKMRNDHGARRGERAWQTTGRPFLAGNDISQNRLL